MKKVFFLVISLLLLGGCAVRNLVAACPRPLALGEDDWVCVPSIDEERSADIASKIIAPGGIQLDKLMRSYLVDAIWQRRCIPNSEGFYEITLPTAMYALVKMTDDFNRTSPALAALCDEGGLLQHNAFVRGLSLWRVIVDVLIAAHKKPFIDAVAQAKEILYAQAHKCLTIEQCQVVLDSTDISALTKMALRLVRQKNPFVIGNLDEMDLDFIVRYELEGPFCQSSICLNFASLEHYADQAELAQQIIDLVLVLYPEITSLALHNLGACTAPRIVGYFKELDLSGNVNLLSLEEVSGPMLEQCFIEGTGIASMDGFYAPCLVGREEFGLTVEQHRQTRDYLSSFSDADETLFDK